jgi:hypothetical protein
MPTLSKSLEKRVQELRASIEAQQKELVAYEHVLELESGKGSTPTESAAPIAVSAPVAAAPASDAASGLEFNGSRSEFVTAILKHSGSAGATPQEVANIFAARKIAISKNLVYNVVSLLFKQKRVKKAGGRYYWTTRGAAAAPAPAAAAPKKRRISEEGMRRIIAATKKRWALQRAAKAKASR